MPLYCTAALADSPAGPAAPSVPAQQPVAPIAVQDILRRANEEQQRIESVRQLLERTSELGAVRVTLAEIADSLNAQFDSASGARLRGLPVMRLESLARHYDFDARRMQAWEIQARRAFEPFDDTAMQLARSRAAWTATRATGAALQLPPVLSGRVDAVLLQIDGADALLAGVLQQEFELMQRASDIKARIDAGRRQVAAVIDEADEQLMRIDAPPLWRATGPGNSAQVWDAMERGIQIERKFAQDYNAAATGNQLALRVVQVLLLVLLLWLAARSRRAVRDAGGPDVPQALRRPVSTWLLLSMLSVMVFEPDAPLLVQEVALVAAVVPVFRLLPARILYASRRWAYGGVILYTLDRASVALIADAGVYRWLLLTLTILAALLTWRVMPYLRHVAPTGGLRRWLATLRVACWAILLVLGVALLCNVLGNVMLAETLASGVIDSAYMAVLLYAGTICCRDITRFLVSRASIGHSASIERHAPDLQAAFFRILVLLAVFGWLLYTLDRFRVLRPLHAKFSAMMGFGIEIGEMSVHVGQVLTLAVSAWLAFGAARGVRRVLREELPGHPGLARGVGSSIASLSYYCVLILGMLFALSAAGVKLGQLAIVFGALGVGVGFGLQNVVNNFVSGLVLMFERPIQPGDTVDAAGVSGTVREVRLRATTIRTFDGADAVIPNGMLLSGSLTNWTMYDRSRRFDIAVGVAYDADPARVLAILDGVVRATGGVATEPAPSVMMTGYGDSALNFNVSAWTEDTGRWIAVRSDLLAAILSALRAAGIAIPYNQLDVNFYPAVPEAKA